jgi:phytoene synthase
MNDASFAACREIVRRSHSNFPLAFRLLPSDQRRGMTALYAWLRATDDLADEPGDEQIKRVKFAEWRTLSFETSRDRTGAGSGARLVLPALHDTIGRFQIPIKHLVDVLDGIESDLAPQRFATFDELYPYCYRVASAVGLACLAIWGVRDPAAAKPAEAAGNAFQLTNILRDLGEDYLHGRVYLPMDELSQFDCLPESWGRDEGAFRRLMHFQIRRALGYYAESEPLTEFLPRPGRAMFRTMRGIYGALLEEIARHPLAVLKRRLRVNPLRKIASLAWEWIR